MNQESKPWNDPESDPFRDLDAARCANAKFSFAVTSCRLSGPVSLSVRAGLAMCDRLELVEGADFAVDRDAGIIYMKGTEEFDRFNGERIHADMRDLRRALSAKFNVDIDHDAFAAFAKAVSEIPRAPRVRLGPPPVARARSVAQWKTERRGRRS